MNKQDTIVFASLVHDIGKFFERAESLDEYCQNETKRQQYCNTGNKGQSGFFHVLRTLRFCELLQAHTPLLKPIAQQDPNEHWADMAANHHNPLFLKQADSGRLLEAADSFASAERESESFSQQGIHKRTCLESLLSRVTINNRKQKDSYFLPLAALAQEGEATFPI
jgi:CRISPR-associated protein Csm1